MGSPRLSVGTRIRYYRTRAHRAQAVIAGLCGITDRYLSLIENGRRTPSADLLGRLAYELGVPIAALVSDEPAPVSTAPDTTLPDVARTLMGYGATYGGSPATPAELRERVEAAWRIWQSSPRRFTDAAGLLPALTADVEHAARAYRASPHSALRREVLRTAADLYGLLRSYARRAGRLDLSLMVADRAIHAAEDADDPVRIAAAQWNLGHVLLSREEPEAVEEARAVATHAARQLQHTGVEGQNVIAMRGALELVAVVADARQHKWWEARRRLHEQAMPLAKQVGEGNALWTVFGPTNVELHAMSVEMMAGEAVAGLRVADQIDTSRLPSRERRFTFGLEVARCYDQRCDDTAVLVHLLGLEKLAPEDLERSPLTRDMITGLLRRVRPTYRHQVNGLAERLHLV